jgi:hypothetical protein
MKELSVGDSRYWLVAVKGDSHWTAHAERQGADPRFGVEFEGTTEEEALDRLTRWLLWQAEHSAALDALQAAERAYHRAVTGGAFANRADGATTLDSQMGCLDAMEAARVRLDAIRVRKPEW